LAILAVTASSVLWSLSTSLKKFLSSVLSVLTICWMAEVIMPDFLISLAKKQQLATELVSSVMVELGYTQAVDIKLVADSQDNRKGHYGEDNSIYLNDTNCISAGVLPKLLLLVSAKLPSP
jgi:hypothetical protein